MWKQSHSKSDFLVPRLVHVSDLIRSQKKKKKPLINDDTDFRMTGISLDVVGLNIVVYASTGITLLFSRFNQFVESGLTTIFLFFSAFLSQGSCFLVFL